jgi:hypothetical protein
MGVSTKRESGIERRVCTERPGHDAEGNDGDMLNGEQHIDVSIRRISQFNRFDLIQCYLISDYKPSVYSYIITTHKLDLLVMI